MYLLIVDPAIKELIVNGLMSQQASETASSSSNEESSSSMSQREHHLGVKRVQHPIV